MCVMDITGRKHKKRKLSFQSDVTILCVAVRLLPSLLPESYPAIRLTQHYSYFLLRRC